MKRVGDSRSASRASGLPRNVKLLGWASLLNDVASEMVFPLLPQFLITALGGSRAQLGVIEGVAESASSLLKLVAGARSDRAGVRKSFVVGGYALAAAARAAVGLVVAPWQLFVARTCDRIGKGVRTSPRDALIADCTSQHNRGRAFGFHRAMDHLGAAVGPVLASIFLWVWPQELRALFLVTLIPGAAVAALLALGLREVSGHAAAREPVASSAQLTALPSLRVFDRNFRIYLVALVVFTLGNSSDGFLLVRAAELGVATPLLPLLWFAFHIVKSSGNYLAGSLVDKLGPRLPLFTGWAIYAVVYLAFGISTSAWHVWFCFAAYGVFYALAEPAEKTLVASLAGPAAKGLAYGWYHVAIGVAALPSSVIFGALYEWYGALVAFAWGAALALVAACILGATRAPD